MEPAQPCSFSRQVSLCMAMQAIIHCGPISRASISKQTGLSKQTVSKLVRILEEQGWVRETGRTSGHVGRSATTYELIPDSAFMAAVDLGGTKLRVAIVDLVGSVLAEMVAPTHPDGGEAVAMQIGALVAAAALEGKVDRARVQQTVVGCPGSARSGDRSGPLCPEYRRDRQFRLPRRRGAGHRDTGAAGKRRQSGGVGRTMAGRGPGGRASGLHRPRNRHRRGADRERRAVGRGDRGGRGTGLSALRCRPVRC